MPNSIQVSGSGIVATRKSCCAPFAEDVDARAGLVGAEVHEEAVDDIERTLPGGSPRARP